MRKVIFCLILSLLIISCEDDSPVTSVEQSGESQSRNWTICEGMMTVKLQDDVLKSLSRDGNDIEIPTGNKELDAYLKSIGAYKMKRVFPNAGKNESKQIEAHLDAWYTVWYKEAEVKTKSSKTNNLFEVKEPAYELIMGDLKVVADNRPTLRNVNQEGFNDPFFPYQWNLFNNGTVNSSISGADINMLSAWKEETGSPEVIVAVVDGGIDINHEDLVDNLWRNPGEIPENGIDDDNNGFIDDVYGFNFVNETPIIEPHNHGTHVAGIIAAKNNNGKGISSIAGGDGSENSGARLMSCQIYMKNPNYNPNDPKSNPNISTKNNNLLAAAIIYGANNGAVISQNSWAYIDINFTPEVIKTAINYFVKYASCSKIQGGLAVFAAANDADSRKAYPAAEKNVVSVAAYAPDFAASYYTNYGDWIDISAPGGSYPFNSKYKYQNGLPTSAILSTIASTDGVSKYGYMQGTSMACPHVSGVAALIVSKYGNSIFTAEELKRRLLSGVKSLNPNDYNVEVYKDKLGSGFLDASVALKAYDTTFVPKAPIFFYPGTKNSYNDITIAWKVSSPAEREYVQGYRIYYSEHPITLSNYKDPEIKSISIAANYTKSNEIFSHKIDKLDNFKTYYFAIQAFARNGKASPLSIYDGAISTLNNTPPSISSNFDLSKAITLAGKDHLEILFTIQDAENHKWLYNITPKDDLVTILENNVLHVKIFAEKLTVRRHVYKLEVTDEYGESSNVNFIIQVVPDEVPKLDERVKPVHVKVGTTQTISLTDLVDDEDRAALKFLYSSVSNYNVKASIHNNMLTVTALKVGDTELAFNVTDKHQQSVDLKLPIFSYKKEGINSLYPTYVNNTLNLRIGNEVRGSFELRINNIVGKQAFQKWYNAGDLEPIKRVLSVDVSSLLPGKYEIRLINNEKVYSESFVKQ